MITTSQRKPQDNKTNASQTVAANPYLCATKYACTDQCLQGEIKRYNKAGMSLLKAEENANISPACPLFLQEE
jgi:hypothetical protein